MKHFFLLVILCLFVTIPLGFSDIMVLPYIGVGYGYNDNLDLVPTATTSVSYLRHIVGVGFAGYFNPDLQSMLSLMYRSDSYEQDYGMIQTLGASGHLVFEVTERFNIGSSIEWFRYIDSAVIINNSNVLSFTPALIYKFSPDLEGKYFYKLNYSEFPNTSENIVESIHGINLLFHLFDDVNVGSTGRFFTAKNEVSSYNYGGYDLNSKLSMLLTSNIEINLEYGIQHYNYPNWNSGRSDFRNIYSLRITKGLSYNTELSFYLSKINNRSSEIALNYENSTGSLAFTWYPEFGRMFVEENTSEYYFNAGMLACEKNNWLDAEKQFRKVLFYDDKAADTLFYLGYSLHKQNRPLEAIVELENTINKDPLFYEAYSLLLLNYQTTNQINKIEKLSAKIKMLALSDERFRQLIP